MDARIIKMGCSLLVGSLFAVILLGRLGAGSQELPCYSSGGEDINLPLDQIIQLADVVLLGRIVAAGEGEFETHSAVLSYYYSYKSDGLLPRKFFWSTSVANYVLAPQKGQLGVFFLFREPSMQLASFCTTPIGALLQSSVEILDYIEGVGLSKYLQ
jgi:hypothetical protein